MGETSSWTAPVRNPDPRRPQNPTEAQVARIMATGAVRARAVFVPYAVGTVLLLAALGCAGLGWLWRVARVARPASADDPWPTVGRLAVVGGGVVLVLLLVTFALVSWRNWAIVSSLPGDGSAGPGEVRYRSYTRTWRPRSWASVASSAVVATTALAIVPVLGAATSDESAAEVGFGLVAVVAGLVGVSEVRQWRYQGSPFASSPRPAWSPPAAAADGPVDHVVAWTAPVMSAVAPTDPSAPYDPAWDDWLARAGYAQNGLVLTDSALLAVTVEPEELRGLPMFSHVYREVSQCLFISGVTLRAELARRLAAAGAAGLLGDGTALRIPREQITGVTVQVSTLVVRLGPTRALAFDFNHPDAANDFASRLSARGLPYVAPADETVRTSGASGAAGFWQLLPTTVSTRQTISLLSLTTRWILPEPYLRILPPRRVWIFPMNVRSSSPRVGRGHGPSF